MKKLSLLFLIIVSGLFSFAQNETFDITNYKAPKGWKKEKSESNVQFSKEDAAKGTYCMITLLKAVPGTTNAKENFDAAWESVVKGMVKPEAEPSMLPGASKNGWEAVSGYSPFNLDGNKGVVMLVTSSGLDKMVNIVIQTNTDKYEKEMTTFLESISFKKLSANTVQNKPVITPAKNNNAATLAKKDGFAFNTTNFDDGWTSTIQEDWVETIKGNTKVLIHFPKEGTVFPADPDKLTTAAWNILVAPRYSNLTNYKTAYVATFNRPYFGMGNVKENRSGKSVFVVLFRRSAGWIEIITPDNNTFTREFGFNPETIRWGKISEYLGGYVVDNSLGITIKADENEVYSKLDNMVGRNKFAVAASDLNNTGEWKDNFSSNTFDSNYYTGAYMGMSTFSSTKWFVFKPGYKYHWELIMGNSYGGQTNIAQGKGDGTFKSLNNWQLYFTNIEGKPKTYDVYFSAIKGGRVLWMNDAQFPGSGIFSGFAKSK